MNRRDLLASLCLTHAVAPAGSASNDEAALRKAIGEIYRTYSKVRDRARYRALLAADYLLLENGQLMDADGDVAAMHDAKEPYDRTDSFDFKHVVVAGDLGYLVYFLESVIQDKNGSQTRRWLESAIFRRSSASWLLAVLHSTRIIGPQA